MRELTQEELNLISGGYNWDNEDIVVTGNPYYPSQPGFPYFPGGGPSYPSYPSYPGYGGGPPPYPVGQGTSFGDVTSEQTGAQADAFVADFKAAGENIEAKANATANQTFTTADGKTFNLSDWKNIFTGFDFNFVNRPFAEGTGGQSFADHADIGNNFFGNYGDDTQNWLIIHETAHQLQVSKDYNQMQYNAYMAANGNNPANWFGSDQFKASEAYNNQLVNQIAGAIGVSTIRPTG